MKSLLATVLVVAACGGSKPAPTAPPPAKATTTGLVIVDDIDCPKLVNHMIDVHVAEAPEKAAQDPDQIKQIRVDMEKKCTEQYTANPPTDEQKASAQCSMKAQTTAALETCGS
jgi:hypothetical protein